jgi:uncharacterized membrane protein YqjE
MADSRIRLLGTLLVQYVLPLLVAVGWQYPIATALIVIILWDAGRKASGSWLTVLALVGLIAVVGTLY